MSVYCGEELVSVVIPAYNAAKYLERSVRSILEQTVIPDEIIIVDDSSGDETYIVASQLAEGHSIPIHVHHHQQNLGVSAARNTGITNAKSEWLLFMDADDIAQSELIDKQLRHLINLQKNWEKQIVLVHSAYTQVSEDEQVLGIHRWKQVLPEEILGYEFIRNQISTSGVLVRREAVIQAGGFDTGLRYSEDWDLWLKLAQIGGFAYVDEPLVNVRRHEGSASATLSKMLDGEKTILNRYEVSFIEDAIHKRHLPWENNRADFIGLLYRIGKWEEGCRFARELVSRHPGLSDGYFLLALYYLSYQDWLNAKKNLLIVIDKSPEHGAALNNLGVILGLMGELDEAIELLERALLFFPGYLDAKHNLNTIKAQMVKSSSDFKITWRPLRPVLLSYKV